MLQRKKNCQNTISHPVLSRGGRFPERRLDKFQAFSEDLIKVCNNINTTKGTYDEAMKKLTEGKDNLVRKTERLRELGAKTSKKINDKLIDRAN